ncbi:MAG: TlpA family protein disulfide reductase, partial [Mesorhizobium sp.]
MADGKRFFFPATRLILAALVAGVLAGAVAVYVSESGSGNNAPEEVAAAAGKDDAACA